MNLDADPLFGLDRDDVSPAHDLAAAPTPVVDADLECRAAGQERQAEESHSRLVPRYVTVCIHISSSVVLIGDISP